MNNFITFIKGMDFKDDEETALFLRMATYFEKSLPDSLYLDPYELHKMTGISNSFWKRFLKMPLIIQLIESEVAMIAEVKARSALKRLGDQSTVSPSEVAAVKALLDKSQILQEKQHDQKTIVFHHIPLDEE
jgi:hypothetical protein